MPNFRKIHLHDGYADTLTLEVRAEDDAGGTCRGVGTIRSLAAVFLVLGLRWASVEGDAPAHSRLAVYGDQPSSFGRVGRVQPDHHPRAGAGPHGEYLYTGTCGEGARGVAGGAAHSGAQKQTVDPTNKRAGARCCADAAGFGGCGDRAFTQHAMGVSDNIVWLVHMPNITTKARLRDLDQHGFGVAELVWVGTPRDWPQSRFQLVAAHLKRGYSGPWKQSPLSHQAAVSKRVSEGV